MNLESEINGDNPLPGHERFVPLHARRAGGLRRLKIAAEIPIGTKLEKKLLADNEGAIDFLGLEGAPVLATPWLVGWMEGTRRDAAFPLMELGQDTVGTHVDAFRLAATPMGTTVTFRAEVIGEEGGE